MIFCCVKKKYQIWKINTYQACRVHQTIQLDQIFVFIDWYYPLFQLIDVILGRAAPRLCLSSLGSTLPYISYLLLFWYDLQKKPLFFRLRWLFRASWIQLLHHIPDCMARRENLVILDKFHSWIAQFLCGIDRRIGTALLMNSSLNWFRLDAGE